MRQTCSGFARASEVLLHQIYIANMVKRSHYCGAEGSSYWLDFADFLKKYAQSLDLSLQRHNHCLERRFEYFI